MKVAPSLPDSEHGLEAQPELAAQSQCHQIQNLRALSQVVQRIAPQRFHLLRALTVQRAQVGAEEALDTY